MKSVVGEFKEFISKGNVLDMAVGLIVGSAFTAIVNSLVDDILMPIIGTVLAGINFSSLGITIPWGNHPFIAIGSFFEYSYHIPADGALRISDCKGHEYVPPETGRKACTAQAQQGRDPADGDPGSAGGTAGKRNG